MKSFIIDFLENKNIFDFPLLVLRGNDNYSDEMGDIDVLVPTSFNNNACYKLIEFIKDDGWEVIGFRELEYLSSIVLINSTLFPNKAIKIDFFGGIGWFGVNAFNNDQLSFSHLLNESERDKASSAITLAHKLMYAGGFSKKDINRLEANIDNSINLLKLKDLVDSNIIFIKKINSLLKWRIRFRLSGYRKVSMLIWAYRISFRYLYFKFKNILRTKGRIFLHSSSGLEESISKIFIDIYSSSGDKNLPIALKSTNGMSIALPRESILEEISIDLSELPIKEAVNKLNKKIDQLIFLELQKKYNKEFKYD